jgi:hypothetical protein
VAGTEASALPSPAPEQTSVDDVPATQLLLQTVRTWKGVDLAPHRYRAVAVRVDDKEVGHLHASGLLDVPFPRPIRDALVEDGMASVHRYVPDSGWITYCVATAEDVDHAAFLLRLSFLYRKIVRAATPADLARIRAELDRLRVGGTLRDVYEALLDQSAAAIPGA